MKSSILYCTCVNTFSLPEYLILMLNHGLFNIKVFFYFWGWGREKLGEQAPSSNRQGYWLAGIPTLLHLSTHMSSNEDIDKHVLRKYEILQKLGKGVSL